MTRSPMHAPFRLLWLALAASLTLLVSLKVGLWLRAPHLHAGDRTQVRACRHCNGSGKDAEIAREVPEMGDRCPFCRGEGKVTVILPGPNHPVRVVGVLVDEEWTGPYDRYSTWSIDRTKTDPLNPTPRKGVLAGGTVRFEGTTADTQETGAHGLITAELPPGTYQVTARKEGFQELRATLVVPPLTEPIWQEAAIYVAEPGSEAEARGEYGLQILVTLAKPGGRPGRLIEAGTQPVP